MENTIESHKFVVKITEDSNTLYDQVKSRLLLNISDQVNRLAQ